MRKPKGHVRPHGTGYQVIVPVGLDPITKRYSYQYGQADTLKEAEKLRDKMLADMAKGRQPRNEATFSQLRRRQQVIPDPNPSSCCRNSHRMPM